jgi:hypothetical protein
MAITLCRVGRKETGEQTRQSARSHPPWMKPCRLLLGTLAKHTLKNQALLGHEKVPFVTSAPGRKPTIQRLAIRTTKERPFVGRLPATSGLRQAQQSKIYLKLRAGCSLYGSKLQ